MVWQPRNSTNNQPVYQKGRNIKIGEDIFYVADFSTGLSQYSKSDGSVIWTEGVNYFWREQLACDPQRNVYVASGPGLFDNTPPGT